MRAAIVKTIAVYGSSSVQPGSPDYVAAFETGRALAEAGYAVVTGGYQGVMEAASRGAAETGGHVIGVTATPIQQLRRAGPNAWVAQVIPYDTLRDRLLHLILHADGYVIMPGGIGTLNELILAWELMRVREIPPRPLVCYGGFWQAILAPLRQTPYVRAEYWDLLRFADSPASVLACIREAQ